MAATDTQQQDQKEKKAFPPWATFLITLGILAVLGVVFYFVVIRKKSAPATPPPNASPKGVIPAPMPGATNASLTSSTAAPAGPTNAGMMNMNKNRI